MGRKLKIFVNPVLLDFFITKKLLDEYAMEAIDIAVMFDDIIFENKYTLGEDKSNDVINNTHYHYRAYVKYTRSGIIKQIKNEKFINLMKCKDNSREWSLVVKPHDKDKDIKDYFGYSIKDTIISTEGFTETEVTEMHSRASTLYKFKLDKIRGKKVDKTKEIMDHLLLVNPIDYGSTCKEIVRYALLNDKKGYLTKNYLKTTALYYLGKSNKISLEELTQLILSI